MIAGLFSSSQARASAGLENSRTVTPGLNVIVPFFDRMIRVDVRERVIDVPPQSVITSDNVVVEVDAVLFSQVTDPFRATYEISNYIYAATKLAQTNMRNIIGELELDASLTSRDTINTKLREVLDTATDKWGIKVNRVEIQRIDPPHDIAEAMSRQMKAERDKRATILESEGARQAEILRAEGDKKAQVLEAEGRKEAAFRDAEARERSAEAEAKATTMVSEAIAAGDVQAINYFVANNYIKALEAETESENISKVLYPDDTTYMGKELRLKQQIGRASCRERV